MSAFKRNIMVGLTVLVALALLGWMVLKFGDAPMWLFAKRQMPIRLLAPSADGVSEGTVVLYKGVNVGRVTDVKRSPDNKYVIVEAMVDATPPLPANVEGRIREQLIGGGGFVNLVLVPADGATASLQPVGQLKPYQEVPARSEGLGLLPPELTELANDLRLTSQEFRKLSVQLREWDVIPKLAGAIDTLQDDLQRAGRLIGSVNDIVGDEQIQANIRQTVANLRKTSESAQQFGQELIWLARNADTHMGALAGSGNKLLSTTQMRIDEVAKQLNDRLVQVSKVLDNVEQATRKLNAGDGAAAKLLNDPKLYENLLDASKELAALVASARRLIEQMEQEGIYLKMNPKK